MRTKVLPGILCSLLVIILSLYHPVFTAECSDHTVGEVDDLIGGIIDYKLGQAGAGSIEEWLDEGIAEGAGTVTDWYALTLSQCGYTDLSAYESSLIDYLGNNSITSATSREKYALALCAAGSNNSYITDILDSSIGGQGMMSWIYGLHVLNNGYTCSRFTADSVVDTILSMQYSDGGWALFGDYGDIDVTAMTVQSLAPHYSENESVAISVERALDFLSRKQKENGGYESFGTPNPESTSQVLTALSALGIDCRYDERFIKNGNDLIDGIVRFRLNDGSFSHTEDGSFNETATVQAYYSFVAFKRMTEGKTPLLVLDNRKPNNIEQQQTEPDKQEVTDNNTTLVTTIAISVSKEKSTESTVAVTAGNTDAFSQTSATGTAGVTSSISQVSTAAIQTAAAIQEHVQKKNGYKPKVIFVIIVSAAVLSLILLIIGKRSIKNFIFIGILAGAGVIIVLVTNISSAGNYYSGEKKQKINAVGTVTMEIRCDTISDKSNSEYIPSDGVILPPTAFDIETGDTVFDILTEAAQTYGIQVENKGSAGGAHGMVYISGINYIYEYDFGDLSGWVYHVNGIAPSRGCGEYILSAGDRVEWLYTCEIGHDLNEVYEK